MAAPVILISASPRRASDGEAQAVRLAGGGALLPYRYAGQQWKGGVTALPTIITSLDFSGGELGTGGVPSATEFEWAPSRDAELAALASYMWIDAPITVRIGPEGALPPIVIAGRVLEATAANGRLKVSLADPAAQLRRPLLSARYAGTGGLEGPAEWDGVIRRRVWGRVWNLRGDPIDKANNVYCFADPLRPLLEFTELRDKGVMATGMTVLDWQGTAEATFAALQAADAPAGAGVVCPSIACVKWWTEPAGDLCADLKGEIGAGYIETTAGIAERLVASLGGPAFAAGTIAAAAGLRPAPVGWVARDDATTAAAMLDELLGNSSLLWLLNGAGEIVIREWAWTAPVASVRAFDITREKTCRPLAVRKLGYKRNELQMGRGDLGAIVLSSRIMIYKRATAMPDLPTVDAVITFATGTITGLDNGWSGDVPAGTDPLWCSAASASGSGATETIEPSAWADPALLGSGAEAPSVSTVFLFQRSTSSTAPAGPSVDTTYTFATQGLAGADGGWTAALPTSGGLYCWMIRATALSTGATDVISPSEWSTPLLTSVQQDAQSLNGLVPATPGGMAALAVSRNFDSGNVSLRSSFTFTKATAASAANWIDFIEAGTYVSNAAGPYTWGSDPAGEVWRRIELDFSTSSFTHDFFEDVAANKYYTAGVRTVRVVDPIVSFTGFVRSGIRSSPTFRPSPTQNYTGALGGLLASVVASATSNFNADNDGNGLVPPAPTGVAISSVQYPDSTSAPSVNWTYTTSTAAGDANNIDGFLVGLYAKTSSAAWTYVGGTVDNVIDWRWVNANVRNVTWTGKPVSPFYWGVVIPFRRVRLDVDLARIVLGTPGQTPAGAGHQPAVSPNFTGNISAYAASLVAIGSNRAINAIDGSNNIAADKVLEASIIAGALNETDYASQGATVAYAANDVTTMGMITTVTVDSSGRLVCRFVPTFYLTKTGPVQGTTYSLDMEIILTPVGSSTVLYASSKYTVKERWDSPTVGTFQAMEQRTGVIEHYFSGVSPGNYGVGYRVSLPSTNGATMPAYRYMNARAPRADE